MEIARQRLEITILLNYEKRRDEIESSIIERIESINSGDGIAGIEQVYCDLERSFPAESRPERIGEIIEVARQRMEIVKEADRRLENLKITRPEYSMKKERAERQTKKEVSYLAS